MSKFRSVLALALAAGGLAVLVPSAGASGSPQGPPAGPTSPPFFQCPAIGLDTTCQFLVDVKDSGPVVLQDSTQGYYDGADDITVAIQNDSSAPISSVHLGVANSGDGAFAFDGDGLCNPGSGPSPDGCPFGPAGNNETPFDYFGPDTVLEVDPASTDDGNVAFTTPLAPGQYTYISLESPFGGTPYLAAGPVNDIVTSSLTDTANPEIAGGAIALPAPADVTDQASLLGPNAAFAPTTSSVTYKVYSDPLCTIQVGESVKHIETEGVIPASGPIGSTVPAGGLPNNAKYYWVAEYSGNTGGGHENTPAKSSCGNQVMTFGTPPALPAPTVATVLTGGGQTGTHITVPPNTPVSDNATVVAPGGQPITGRLSYEVYSDPSCAPFTQIKGAGGGLTTGAGPASAALSLPAGTYYFQASYSGNGTLGAAVSPCGSEVLTVPAATPTPPPPSSVFIPVGNPQFNPKTGQLAIIAAFPVPGTATSTGIVQQGATLARAGEAAFVREALAEVARHRKSSKCKRGFVKKGKKCVNNAPVVYGTTVLAIPSPGTYTIIINPSAKALKALKAGKKLNVVTSTTFLAKGSTVPTTQIGDVQVKLKLKKPKHKHRKH